MNHRSRSATDGDTQNVPSLEEDFAQGKYSSVAMRGDQNDWRTYAAYGLIGKCSEAVEGLQSFSGDEPRFYRAVAHWIAGDEDHAIQLLEHVRTDHAKNLLALIRKPRIRVLSQLPWRRGGSSDLISGITADAKFLVNNISFHSEDLPNRPYANVHRFYDPSDPPDFYICQMVEWHVIPPNLQELPCPIFGQTADYDLHIQAVFPWFSLFDEMIVTDATEWQDVSGLVSVPVSTFPKSFGLSRDLPPVWDGSRPFDLFWSGTIKHAYHPDKAGVLQSLLDREDLDALIIDGILDPDTYFTLLSQSKAVVSYYRHSGGMVTRGLDALAMGCSVAVHKDNVLTLYAGEDRGVVTYESPEDLVTVISRVVKSWPDFETRARSGAQSVREEFDIARVASQYLRYLTFLAAKPRPISRSPLPAQDLRQKRFVLCKGWYPDALEDQQALVNANLERWKNKLARQPSVGLILDTARELALWAYHVSDIDDTAPLFRRVFGLYRAGLRLFPRSLVMRVNFIRLACHFGDQREVAEAIACARETVAGDVSRWHVDVMDDVFPYDFLSHGFDYRTYFDCAMRCLVNPRHDQRELCRVLLATVHFYLGHYEHALEHFKQAASTNPEFPFFTLRYAQALIKRGEPESFREAAALLVALAQASVVAEEAVDLLDQLHREGHVQLEEFSRFTKLADRLRSRVRRCPGFQLPGDKSSQMPSFKPAPLSRERPPDASSSPVVQEETCVRNGETAASRAQRHAVPALSCLVVSHNKPHYLGQAVQSLIEQTFSNWEAVIMDSGVLFDQGYFDRQPWKDDPRIRIVKSGETPEMRRERAMAPWCWNECHRRGLVRGELVVYLCDDDVWYPHAFQTFVEFFHANPCAVAMYASEDMGLITSEGALVSLGERRATSVGGRSCHGRVMDCQVDYLQFCHRRSVLGLFASEEYWPEGLETQSHADGVFMERVGAYVPIYPHDVKVGLNRRTPQSTYLPAQRFVHLGQLASAQPPFASDRVGPPRSRPTATTVTCSIIVPVFNRAELTRNCLTRLAETTKDVDYEVIVVDNGSTDDTSRFLARLEGDVRVLHNEHNLGFAKACNQGARLASGKYLVFLNNDTLPQEHWLLELVNEADSSPDVAVVGSKLLFPDGTIQHAGLVFDRELAIPYSLYYRTRAHPGDCADHRRELQAVTGACLLIRREMFEAVGGFDERFRNGFEDVDLCLRVCERGGKVVYQPKSCLVHLEGQTTGRKDHDAENLARFREKWRDRWLADQDLVLFEDGIADITTSADLRNYRELRNAVSLGNTSDGVQILHRLETQEDRQAWAHVAQLQRLLLQMGTKSRQIAEEDRELWASLRSVLGRAAAWPRNDLVLDWAASVCVALHLYAEAEAFWLRALQFGERRCARMGLAKLLMKRGRCEEAEHHVSTLLRDDPHDEEVWHIRGVGLLHRERYADAVAAFQRAGRRPAALKGLGMACMGANRPREAFEAFGEALRAQADDAEALNWLLRAGTALEKWADLADALSTFLARNPAHCDFRFALAGVYLRAGRTAEALHEYRTLAVLHPDYDGLDDLAAALQGDRHEHMAKVEPVSG